MAQDKDYQSRARSDATAARRAAYGSGEIVTSHTMVSGPTEQRSRLDTTLNTSTTPQSAIDSWGAPVRPAPVQSQTGGSEGASSEPATPETADK